MSPLPPPPPASERAAPGPASSGTPGKERISTYRPQPQPLTAPLLGRGTARERLLELLEQQRPAGRAEDLPGDDGGDGRRDGSGRSVA
ncbi:MAG TPA: hypothetical protein VD813_02170 [Pseudonocardia sp.]|nr:hypothetical protein [Pseudonocardia sp.]